jgi:hypothetical protein
MQGLRWLCYAPAAAPATRARLMPTTGRPANLIASTAPSSRRYPDTAKSATPLTVSGIFTGIQRATYRHSRRNAEYAAASVPEQRSGWSAKPLILWCWDTAERRWSARRCKTTAYARHLLLGYYAPVRLSASAGSGRVNAYAIIANTGRPMPIINGSMAFSFAVMGLNAPISPWFPSIPTLAHQSQSRTSST